MRGLLKFIGFIAFLVLVWFVRAQLVESGIRSKSLAFVTETVGAITLNWNRAILDRNADPALPQLITAAGTSHVLDFPFYAQLGARESELDCKIIEYTTYKDETRDYIAVTYGCTAHYVRGDATVRVTILRDKETTPWRFSYFDVISPLLTSPQPPATQR